MAAFEFLFVARLIRVTEALATALPLWSVTRPRTLPVTAWAQFELA